MTQSFRHLVMVSLVILILALSMGFQPTRADTPFPFYVDSFEDINDFVLNSVCSVGEITEGPCTLRAAIAEANAIINAFDIVIYLPAGNYDLAIPPDGINDITSGDLNFEGFENLHAITLIGTDPQPAVIDAKFLDRVLRIEPGAIVYLENIVVRGGLLSQTDTDSMYDGAGILNFGRTYLTKVVVEDNEASCGQETCAFYISGGGIFNTGQMIITD
jgi:CSLREA domain-containing protein